MANTKLPARLLDTSAIPALNVTGDLTVDTTTLKVDSSNNRVKMGDTAVASATNAPLHVAKSSTDVQAIFGDNNTSIDDPSIRIIGRDTGNSAIRYMFAGLDADANHGFVGYNHGSGSFVNALNFDTSGNVGIGTTSPASILHVDEGAADDCRIIAETHAGGDSMILFSQGASGSGTPTWGIGLDAGSGTSDGLSIGYEDTGYNDFSLTGDSKVVITTDGKVGIGTTTPDCLLHVDSSDHTVARIKAGTDKQASLRLQNDAQHWGIQCQTSDHFQIENLTVSAIPFQMNPDGYLVLARNANEYGLQIRSAGTRSGLVIDKPGTSTIMGSALVIAADERFKLGTASYYHIEMKQNGDTKINQNLLLTDSFGLRAYSGYFAAGTSTGTFIFNTYGSGVYEITAAFGHYGYIPSYGCFKKAICSNGQGYVNSNTISVTDIATEITTTNGGSWSFSGYDSSSVPSGSNTTGTVRVVKNAGSYGGGGYYFVEIRGNQSS